MSVRKSCYLSHCTSWLNSIGSGHAHRILLAGLIINAKLILGVTSIQYRGPQPLMLNCLMHKNHQLPSFGLALGWLMGLGGGMCLTVPYALTVPCFGAPLEAKAGDRREAWA